MMKRLMGVSKPVPNNSCAGRGSINHRQLLIRTMCFVQRLLLAMGIMIMALVCLSGISSKASRQGANSKKSSHVNAPKSYVQPISNTLVKFEMVYIPGGIYEMPDPTRPGSKRKVVIKSFWMGKTEVTWDEYDVFMYRLDEIGTKPSSKKGAHAVSRPTKPYGAPDRGFGHHGYPVMSITYYAAEQYCRWLSLKTGRKYRLPTEAEWEYACRAGVLPAGPIANKAWLNRHAWFRDNSDEKTHPVATKEPNAWGLYDMLGNVAEWCRGIDGRPVVRGGSYIDPAEKVHPAARQHQTPEWNASDPQIPKSKWWLPDAPFVGFRVVCEE